MLTRQATTLLGRAMAAILYFLGARCSEYSGNPVLVLHAEEEHRDYSFCGMVFPDCRSYVGVTVRQDGSARWVVGYLQIVDGLEEVVDETRFPPRGLRHAVRYYRERR